jgi:hypothetical protein
LVIVAAIDKNIEALHIETKVRLHLFIFYNQSTRSIQVKLEAFDHKVKLNTLQEASEVFGRYHADFHSLELLFKFFPGHHVFIVYGREVILDTNIIVFLFSIFSLFFYLA